MSPECMAGICEIGWFGPVLPAAAWADLCWWRYIEEQDLSHPSSSGQSVPRRTVPIRPPPSVYAELSGPKA